MYGYKTMHALLSAYVKWDENKDSIRINNKMPFDLLYINANILLKNKFKKLEYVKHTLLYLSNEKDFFIEDVRNEKGNITGLLVSATSKGLAAYAGKVYLKKQHQWFWGLVMNSSITVATVGTAIFTGITLLSIEPRITQLENKVEKLQEKYVQLPAITNPKIRPHKTNATNSTYTSITKNDSSIPAD